MRVRARENNNSPLSTKSLESLIIKKSGKQNSSHILNLEYMAAVVIVDKPKAQYFRQRKSWANHILSAL